MSIILDTGPLVAFLNRSRCVPSLGGGSVVECNTASCSPVKLSLPKLAIWCELSPEARLPCWTLVARGVVEIPFVLADQAQDVARLLKKYSNVPMSLADGCLVRMAERLANSAIMTLDSDFAIYRRNGREDHPTADSLAGLTGNLPGWSSSRDAGTA